MQRLFKNVRMFKIFLISFVFFITEISGKNLNLEQNTNGIVLVKVTSQTPNFQFPWMTKKPVTTEIIGVFIKRNLVLVLASYLEYATSVAIKYKNNPNPSPAQIQKIDLDSNLALLEVRDEKNIQPISFDDKFDPKSEFTVVHLDSFGNPLLSLVRGISISVEQQSHSHLELPYLNVNVNEKLDGIGEILFLKNKAVGIFFKHQTNKSIGKVIPGFIINQFIEHEKKGKTFAFMGFQYQPLLDPTTKEYYKFPYEGVIVSEIIPYSSAYGILKIEDIIFQIDDFKIDSQGNFEHPDANYGKQPISFLLNAGKEIGFQIGSKIKLKVWREGKEIDLKMKLKPFPEKAIQIPHAHNYGNLPRFLIANGFIFTELSEFLLREWGNNWRTKVDKKLLYLLDYHKFHKTSTQGKIVVLVQVLPDDSNNGYHNLSMEILQFVNNKKVTSIKDLYKFLYESKQEIVILDLDNGTRVAIDAKQLPTFDEKIANKFGLTQLKNF